MRALSAEQLAFLAEKGVPLSRVFDATGMSKTEYHDQMKGQALWIAYGVTPCGAAGHRMRTRAGHCVQCKPAVISFMARNDAAGMVYVAHSSRRHYTKVGSAEDADVRVRSLNTHRYGQIDDWKLVWAAACERAGQAEFFVHRALAEHHLPRSNTEGANSLESQELFSCSPDLAVQALKSVLARK